MSLFFSTTIAARRFVVFPLSFYTFTLTYTLILIGAYHAFCYNSPKRSVVILSIAIILDSSTAFCSATGILTSSIGAGFGSNSYMIIGSIFGLLVYTIFLLSFIPYKKGNLQLHQKMIFSMIILGFLASAFWSHGIIEFLLPFKPMIP